MDMYSTMKMRMVLRTLVLTVVKGLEETSALKLDMMWDNVCLMSSGLRTIDF